MQEDDLPIGPSTRVAALLDRYPELEDVLIELAPPFRKLKNPILRRSVARVASLGQAAAAANLPVGDLVNRLRSAVGQDPIPAGEIESSEEYLYERPDWFDAAEVTESIDAREGGDPDRMTIAVVLPRARRLRGPEILELVTTFVPAPGIDILRKKGFDVWSTRTSRDEVRTYVRKPGAL